MRTRSIVPPPAAAAGVDLLGAAAGIGERLVREAIWYRGQCTWIGVERAACGDEDDRRRAHHALGPSLGAGTAGIALFLAQLDAVTGSEATRRTARGAIAQALARADSVDHGLYGGRPGIAYAAARCGSLLGDERLVMRGARLARARPSAPARACCDVVGATAGSIVALLALAARLDDRRLVGRAAALGDALVAAARRGPDGWCWPPAAGRHGLCGMAGASGAAWALLELFATTGDERHRAGAAHALDYERGWYDPEQANWPDLRAIARRERRGTFRPPCATTWCDGAAGIALSRLRGWQILGDERLRDEAVTALTTTAASVERSLLVPRADFSLSRGLAGGAEALLLGGALLPGAAALARRVGEVGAGRYATSLDGWPSGGGRTPALLTGDAGIGLLLLRLRDSATAPVLLLGAPSP